MIYKKFIVFLVLSHGINNDNIGPIAKASFEETPEMFLNAAKHADLDTMRGVSANVMCGQEGFFGTNAFQVVLDYEKITQLNAEEAKEQNAEKIIENGFDGYTNVDDSCSIQNIKINSNISGIKPVDMGVDDGYEFDM